MQNVKYELKPALEKDTHLFYSMTSEKIRKYGCIGHVRMDFGRGGKEFWHTWHPHGPESLNSPAFKAELAEVVNEMRKSVLKDLASMTDFCRKHGGEISGGWAQSYGYIAETVNYRYCLRCNPVYGDYQAYLVCFDKQAREATDCADVPAGGM